MDCRLSQIVDIVSAFVARSRGPSVTTVEPGTQLLQEGLIDSFALVELIGEMETALQAKIPEGMLVPQDFETPKILFERLLQI
jgi:acyl carrier protein